MPGRDNWPRFARLIPPPALGSARRKSGYPCEVCLVPWHNGFSFDAAKNRHLEILPIAIHIVKSHLAQPGTLFFDRRQDVGPAIGPLQKVSFYLFEGHSFPALAAPL